jgi:hypothetical protein
MDNAFAVFMMSLLEMSGSLQRPEAFEVVQARAFIISITHGACRRLTGIASEEEARSGRPMNSIGSGAKILTGNRARLGIFGGP